jgi:ATP-dependent Lon protease
LLASMIGLPGPENQLLLKSESNLAALEQLHKSLNHQLEVAQMKSQIALETRAEIENCDKQELLRQQLATIQKQLGVDKDSQSDIMDLRQRAARLSFTPLAQDELNKQLDQLQRMPAGAAEYQVARSYVDLLLDMPWLECSTTEIDISHARKILDEDHFGLLEVKERILEHLAVMRLNIAAHAPILCLVGPPGTGKTSLGHSIAGALGRKFERISLGGMHDEAELRGHRRTYIGAMPGRLIQAIRRAKVNNPLLMLDEIDKLCRDYQGDPSAALLEVLDPAQNHEFHDNYLDVAFDLSRVFFITTANTLDSIPRALLDRMEVITLSGYTREEKLGIGSQYLVPKQISEAGLSQQQLTIPEETLSCLIKHYTREAGVRELERSIARLARKTALKILEVGELPPLCDPAQAKALLGEEDFHDTHIRSSREAGVAAGLAWTEAGGQLLYLEVALVPGNENLLITGNLGNVMKESAQAALSYVLSHGLSLGCPEIPPHHFIHLHAPEGAIPKDGPSAGLAMACALASAISGLPLPLDTAMTGEITLSGLVLPVGGIKEKLIAAREAGIKRVLLPRENENMLGELSAPVLADLEITLIDRVDEAIRLMLPTLGGRY